MFEAFHYIANFVLDLVQRFGDRSSRCRRLFPHFERHSVHYECRRCGEKYKAFGPNDSP